MMEYLVIGIGNSIRGDDGLGWVAADQLASQVNDPELSIMRVPQLTMDLVEPLSKVDQVVFIDARIGNSPGRIDCKQIEANTALDSPITHFFNPGTLLAAVQALYGHHPQATLFTVECNNFEYIEQLSPQVQAALPPLISKIRKILPG